MDYKKIYDNLIFRAQDRLLDCQIYYENHHIIPKCLGGTDDNDNLVYLLPEEHYIAHLLLIKIYNNPKLIHAANMMVVSSKNNKRNNKSYAWVRKKHANAISINQSGIGNSQHGSMWITDGWVNKKIKKEDIIPKGWNQGRSNLWNDDQKKQIAERNKKAQTGTTRSKETKDKISNSLKNRKRGRAVDYLSLEN